MLIPSLFATVGLTLFPLVTAHGYISNWTVPYPGGATTKAQKTPLAQTAFRSVSNNTGFVGSAFISSPATVCGAFNTPFNTTSPPGPPFFSDASQSAGFTMNTPVGEMVQLIISGNPGQGWPHPGGNMAVYLGMCGTGPTDCQNFDASTADWFKIKSDPNGVPNVLHPAYDPTVDGNRYNISLPAQVPTGSYILRLEILGFGLTNAAEGDQVEIYPFCGQLYLSGSNVTTLSKEIQTIKLPTGYAGLTLQTTTLPGPPVIDPKFFLSTAAQQQSSGGSSKKLSIGAIVGIAVGGFAALVIAGLLLFMVLRRSSLRRRNESQMDYYPPAPPPPSGAMVEKYVSGGGSLPGYLPEVTSPSINSKGLPPGAGTDRGSSTGGERPLSPISDLGSVQHRPANPELWDD